MLKKIVAILITSVLSFSLTFADEGSPASVPQKSIGKINFLLGGPKDVRVKRHNSESWRNVKLKMQVNNGDVITTAKESRCEVKLNEGSIVRIGEQSTFEFSDATLTQTNKKVRSKLTRGKVWTNIQKYKGGEDEFKILAPTAVCAVRGTVYRVDADSTTRVAVYDGEVDVGPVSFWGQQQQQPKSKSLKPVEVPGPYEIPGPYEVSLEEWIRIVRGFQVEVRPDGKYAKSRIDTEKDSQSPWVRWNQERDRAVGRN